MDELVYVERKGAVLNHPALPCLAAQHAVNLAGGCPFACRYCYAQSFRGNPGPGKVVFYRNSFELLRRELATLF